MDARAQEACLAVFAARGWLAGQAEAFRARLLRLGHISDHPARRSLVVEGTRPDSLLGLVTGCWSLTRRVGGENVAFHLATPGFWVGDTAVLGGQRMSHALNTVLPSRVIAIPGPSLRRLLHDEPEWWPCMFALRRTRVAQVAEATACQITRNPRALLARRILEIADGRGVVHATRNDLAAILGVARGTVQRALRSLADKGAVEPRYGAIAVRDRAALEAMADGARSRPSAKPR
jgi:CRP-like cAMP-binding protein